MSVVRLARVIDRLPARRVRRVRLEPGHPFIVGCGAAVQFYVMRGTQEDGSDTLLLELMMNGRRFYQEMPASEPYLYYVLDGGVLHLTAVEFDGHKVQAIHLEARDELESIHATA